MESVTIQTKMGEIAVYKNEVVGTVPIIFLHGVYLDHHLWDEQVKAIQDRTTIAIDMPFHGKSRVGNPKKWSVDDCADMLIEILDKLDIDQVIAIGHSWGSMTVLRAVVANPKRFISIGLCNMPFESAPLKRKLQFFLQHLGIPFRALYTTKAGEALMYQPSEKLLDKLRSSMRILNAVDLVMMDSVVITNIDDTRHLLDKIQVPALAIKGEHDYVPNPDPIPLTTIPGGHISPWEYPEEVTIFIQKVINHKL